MENDKMVKGIMKKKLYSEPRVEAIFMDSLGTIMKTSQELPPDSNPAPRRPTDLF